MTRAGADPEKSTRGATVRRDARCCVSTGRVMSLFTYMNESKKGNFSDEVQEVAGERMEKKPPTIEEIQEWLEKENPLGFFRDREFTIVDIDPKAWSGHFNFLVDVGGKKMVLRWKGPEWGEPVQGIVNEYRTLEAIGQYHVGPNVYDLIENFFGEPALLEEYLEGESLSAMPEQVQAQLYPDVARLICRINQIPVEVDRIPFRRAITSYEPVKKKWRSRLDVILENPYTKLAGEKIEELLPPADRMLDAFEPRLKRVLEQYGPAFIFESAHSGHCLRTADGVKFLNWENVSYGDPSYTLAVFLASIADWPDSPQRRKEMIGVYLEQHPIEEFRELVDQRLDEREVSNLIWSVWSHAYRGVEKTLDLSSSRRYEKVRRVLSER